MISNGASFICGENGDTPLHNAISCNNLRLGRFFLENFPLIVDYPNCKTGARPLHYAVLTCNLPFFHLLREFNANANLTDLHQQTPYMAGFFFRECCQPEDQEKKDLDVILMLLSGNVTFDYKINDDSSPPSRFFSSRR